MYSVLVCEFQVTSKPQVIDEVDRRLIQLEMEKLSLRKETKRDALQRVEQIDREVDDLKTKQVCDKGEHMCVLCGWSFCRRDHYRTHSVRSCHMSVFGLMQWFLVHE